MGVTEMTPTNQKSRITRRGFFQQGAGALAAAGIFVGADKAKSGSGPASHQELTRPDPPPMTGKVALEEHFALPEAADAAYQIQPTPNFRLQMLDIGEKRIAEMDRGGVELCLLSHTAPGIQGIPNTSEAIATARRWNDYLAQQIAKYPKRLKGLAALPMQEPQAAAQELTRCIKELGFCGALVNGFSQIGEADSAVYYDLPQYRPFWAAVQQLNVPFYLHPRSPLITHQQPYEGHEWIAGSPWGYAVETSIHALRLMSSGLFDEYPKLNVILGHLGEGLLFGIWRIDNRIRKLKVQTQAKLPMGRYLRENFYITTSGVFRTQALADVMQEIGSDRVLYSVDYPYEDMGAGAEWFDHASIAEGDRAKIAYRNAQMLFRL